MATSAVMLTFVVVFTYLGPISKGGISSLLKNSNLLFKDSFYGVIPTALYGVFYVINVLTHMENGKVNFKYDWYWFVQSGVWTAIIVIPIIFIISYLISYIIWKLNHTFK